MSPRPSFFDQANAPRLSALFSDTSAFFMYNGATHNPSAINRFRTLSHATAGEGTHFLSKLRRSHHGSCILTA